MVTTEQEFLEWKENSTTKEFFKGLRKERERIKENVVRSSYDNEERVKGIAQGLQDLIEMDYNNFKEMFSND